MVRVLFRGIVSFLVELQCRRIDAVTLACGRRAVIENVPQVCIASRAEHFCSPHAEAIVLFQSYIQIGDGIEVAWPARSRMELGRCFEEVCPAADALIYARFTDIIESACKRPLRALVGSYTVLLGSQHLLPLRIRLADLVNVQYLILTAVEDLHSFHVHHIAFALNCLIFQ